MDRRKLRETAKELRARSNSTTPPFSTRKIVSACFPGTIVTGGELPPGVDEVVSRVPPNGAIIVYERSRPWPRHRFVIAHALAHLLFDDESKAHRGRLKHDLDMEERADWFAAELLVPLEELEPLVYQEPAESGVERDVYLDMVDELASTFAVPTEIIDWRIKELLLIGRFAA